MTTSDLKPEDLPRIEIEASQKYMFLFASLAFIAGIVYMTPIIWSPTETTSAKWLVVGLDLFLFICLFTSAAYAASIVVDEQGISKKLLGRFIRHISWINLKEIQSQPELWNNNITRSFLICKKGNRLFVFFINSNNVSDIQKFIELFNFYIKKYDIKVRWADALMTDLKDYKDLKQLPPPPYGED